MIIMLSFLHGLSVDVISLFEVKSRRRRNDMNYHLRKAFRLCIDESQVDRLLNENSWPVDIVISYWFFLKVKVKVNQAIQSDHQK